ncbi:PspA/IM30 family protein [Pseudogracilibacillus sp. SE30717A]|uniref:PspA/IM30 family protein n=1 Tax=Pseudogracilibacillus sp. SE30717A TaxID=3098293 RepID=UPI00300E06C0
MSNVFTRIKDAISADVHQLLDQKEEKNPIAALNNYLRQSEIEKEKVKKLLQRHYKLKEEFTNEYHQAEEQAMKRKSQADIAKRANEEELYHYAMKEYEEYDRRAKRMKTSRENTIAQIEQLESKYKEMNHKLKDMKLKQMELMGRENVARTNQQINRVLHGDGENAYNRFNELESFIDRIEKKVNKAYYESTFDQRIADLERDMNFAKENSDENRA